MDWLYPIFGFAGKQYDRQTSEAARGLFLKNAALLEQALQNGRAYLVGQKLSLADVVVAAQLIPSYLVVSILRADPCASSRKRRANARVSRSQFLCLTRAIDLHFIVTGYGAALAFACSREAVCGCLERG